VADDASGPISVNQSSRAQACQAGNRESRAELCIGRNRLNGQEPLDFFSVRSAQSKCDGKPKLGVGHGARGDIAELGNIPQREIHRLAGRQQFGDALNGWNVAWMIGLGASRQAPLRAAWIWV
jgi:hypothetical protein